MATYVIAAFVDRVEHGLVFDRGAWPLHITLVHFSSDLAPDHLAGLVASPARELLGAAVRVGGDERFGRRGRVQVSLVEPDERLQHCHEMMTRTLINQGASITSPHHSMENYRPHVSVSNDRRVHEGDIVPLKQVGLVEMRPDGDTTIRRIPELWSVE